MTIIAGGADALPVIFIELPALGLLALFPALATWPPGVLCQ